MKFREYTLSSGTKILLGKDETSNDELMKLYSGKENFVIHTIKPGSPFCVIDKLNPTKQEIQESALICASKSQDWRDNKSSVKLHLFKAKDSYKNKSMKSGTWALKGRPKIITIKKQELENFKKWQ